MEPLIGIEKISQLKFNIKDSKRFLGIEPRLVSLFLPPVRNFSYLERRDNDRRDVLIQNTHKCGSVANYWYIKLADLSDILYIEDLPM
jgi:hypothetical protein